MKNYVAPIEAVSLGLKSMVEKEVLLIDPNNPVDSADVKLSFDEPSSEFVSSLGGKPVINLYLYRMQEKLERRFSEDYMKLANQKDCKLLIGRRPMFIELFYAVTVWMRSQKDSTMTEQNLISRFIQGMGKYEIMDKSFLKETNFDPEPFGLPILYFAEDPLRNQTEFWSALGSTPKPMIPLSVTVPVKIHEPVEMPFVRSINRKFAPSGSNNNPENKSSKMTLSGKIINYDSLNSKDLQVHIMMINHSEISQIAEVEASACYRFYDMPAGIYYYWVSDLNDKSRLSSKKIFELKENQSGEVITLTLDINVEF